VVVEGGASVDALPPLAISEDLKLLKAGCKLIASNSKECAWISALSAVVVNVWLCLSFVSSSIHQSGVSACAKSRQRP
jgi:hypothetical protein